MIKAVDGSHSTRPLVRQAPNRKSQPRPVFRGPNPTFSTINRSRGRNSEHQTIIAAEAGLSWTVSKARRAPGAVAFPGSDKILKQIASPKTEVTPKPQTLHHRPRPEYS